jgi:hypothetical protein
MRYLEVIGFLSAIIFLTLFYDVYLKNRFIYEGNTTIDGTNGSTVENSSTEPNVANENSSSKPNVAGKIAKPISSTIVK